MTLLEFAKPLDIENYVPLFNRNIYGDTSNIYSIIEYGRSEIEK